MEYWKDVKEYDNYEVSNNGGVLNKKIRRVLKHGINTNGYPIVVLSKKGVTKTKTIHRLVANAFIEGCNDGLVIDHKDGNKENNNISNLEFCTSSENNKRAYDNGLKNPSHPYNQPNSRKVRVIETGEIYSSVRECARNTGGNSRHICDCLNGRLKKHNGLHYEDVE